MNNYSKDMGVIDGKIIYPIADLFSNIAFEIGLTPNIITLITLLIRLYCLYLLYIGKSFKLAIILFIISWLTDALDGIVARKYNMKSEYGAKFDEKVDRLTLGLTAVIMIKKYYNNNIFDFLLFFLAILFSYLTVLLKRKIKSTDNKKPENFIEKIVCIINGLKLDKFINLIDDGFIYLLVTACIYYGMFIIK